MDDKIRVNKPYAPTKIRPKLTWGTEPTLTRATPNTKLGIPTMQCDPTIASLTQRAARAVGVVVIVAMFSACSRNSTPAATPTLFYGPSQVLGNGTVRTYVAVNAAGQPVSVGVALTELALANLPTTPRAPNPSALTLSLAMPSNAPSTGYNHVMLDWNPQGHEPDHVYTLPHFDFHFFRITETERDSIMPNNPAFAIKAALLPPPEFVPPGYRAAHLMAGVSAVAAAKPMMGMHWRDTSSPELQPPPANHMFTETFIYGSYNGKFIFVEPMITKTFMESLKGTAGMSRTVSTAGAVQTPGYYPNAYSIRYDVGSKQYHIALNGLTYRQ